MISLWGTQLAQNMKELDTVVERVNGFDRRSTWYPAVSDAIGQEIDGITGREIVVRRQVIKPIMIFEVRERK